MNLKIRDKIIGVMVLLIVLPIALLGWRSYSLSSTELRTQYEEMGNVISQEVNLLIRDRIGETNKLITDLSLDPNLLNLGEEVNLNNAKAQFNRTMDSYGFTAVYFGSTDGTMYTGSAEGNTIDVRERPWYTDAIQTEDAVWSEVYEDGTSGENTVTVSKAVYNGSQLIGVVAIDLNLKELSDVVTEVEVMGGHPIVMDEDGIIIIEKDPAWVGQRFDAKDEFDENIKEPQTIEYSFVDEANNQEIKELIIMSPIAGTDWSLATIIGLEDLDKMTSIMKMNILAIGLISVVVGIIVSILFGRGISNSVNQILAMIKRMEDGDFTARIDIKNTDEFGQLRDGFNAMMDTISGLINRIKVTSTSVDEYSGNLAAIAEEVNASSYEVSKTSEEIAKGASSQANDTEQGVVLINNMSDKLLDLDSTSDSMVGLAKEIKTTNEDGVVVVDDLKDKTQKNNESAQRVEEEIIELDRKISEVTEILSTIDAISEQTNLLALNASIEAARAGEYGKGFAVVADEIRQLAGESKESSNTIKSIIEGVQVESKRTVDVMGQVKGINVEQTQAVERVSESFGTINNLIEQIVSKIGEIDKKSTEMNQDRNSIVGTIENISAISQETAAASEEVTASIEEQTSATEEVANSATKLNELSAELNREISVFKV